MLIKVNGSDYIINYMLFCVAMNTTQKVKLPWIKYLMIVSQVVLVVFTAQWLVSQYNRQEDQLKTGLNQLFADMQQQISDSLLLNNVITPETLTMPVGTQAAITPKAYLKGDSVKPLSSRELSLLLKQVAHVSSKQEKALFSMDTIAFNELFTSTMRHNGWNFTTAWINNTDAAKMPEQALFIKSNFFTREKGLVVSNYRGYLLGRIVPQMLFILVLLSLTGAACWLAYKSLNQQLKLGQLKDDFISNMSHELKTPIATVKVALEALNNFNVIDNPQRSREYLAMAILEMDRLELLATEALNTSLLESGKLFVKPEPYNIKLLVEEVLQVLQLRLQQHNATVHFETTGTDFVSAIDKLHTQGVLINLVDNSLKYGIAPVKINIALIDTGDTIQLSVADNGPGIPEEYKERVFEKFFRVPAGNEHKTKGYGLGLSYAAQIMRQHNGSIQVNNIAGGGCRFTLTF
jgi:signal transduction histidine kinase